MSVLDRPEHVPVPLGFCPCLGSPHEDGDIVYLYPELSMAGGMAAQGAISEASGDSGLDGVRLQELLAEVWIRHGVASWTFLDDNGEAIPVSPSNIAAALPYAKGGRAVADKADDLYAEAVTAPLVERLAALSKRGSTRTPGQTSPNRATRRKQRSPSSTATTDKVPLAG
jgi:hypothetical protein